MNHEEEILIILETNLNDYVSGVELAHKLGISRQAIWKIINKLKLNNYEIKTTPKKGYILTNENDKILPYYIKSKLNEPTIVKYQSEVTSTNNWAKHILVGDNNSNTLLLCDTQSKGRGRFNREFISPKDKGIYFSLILDQENSNIEQLTCLCAVAIIRSLKQCFGLDASIKWVNDIILNNKKLAGILCESTYDYENQKIDQMIIGIGLNYHESEIGPHITSLSNYHKNLNRNDFIISIINNIFTLLHQDINVTIQEYINSSLILNKEITFKLNNIDYNGRVIKIENNGSLIIECLNELININSGEVSIKGYYEN